MQVVIEINEARADTLERIRETAGLSNYREIFNNSLTLLDWAIAQRIAGKVVASVDKDTNSYEELAFDSLNRLSKGLQNGIDPSKTA